MAAETKGSGDDRSRRDPFRLFLVVACLALSVLVILLARQNRELKRSLADASESRLPADALKTGDRVEPFGIVSPAGEPSRLEFGGNRPKTLLLVFSSRCPACEKTLPVWNDLLARPLRHEPRAIGLQLDMPKPGSDPGGLLPASLRFPVFGVERPDPPLLAKIPYVPAAILLDANGLVIRTWYGFPSDVQIEEIQEEIVK